LRRAQYSKRKRIMNPVPLIMSDELLQALEIKMDQLIQVCERLQHENGELRAKANDWQRERVRLVEKNELARGRVEAMITRLKSLESDS